MKAEVMVMEEMEIIMAKKVEYWKKLTIKLKIRGPKEKLKKKRSGGGFNIAFEDLGNSDYRAKYEEDTRTIIVNTGHPFLKKIEEMAGDRDSTKYMRPAWEAALFEYAAAITTQKGASNMLDDSLTDGVIEMQERVDKLLRKMTALNIFND